MNFMTSSVLNGELLFANFNLTATSLVVGCKCGYKTIELSLVKDLQENFVGRVKDICLVERFSTSCLVAYVSLSKPRKLILHNLSKDKEICNYGFGNTILAVKINKTHMVVLLENMFCIYAFNGKSEKPYNLNNIPPNPKGICALGVEGNNLLAYPGSAIFGEVQLHDMAKRKTHLVVFAHRSPIAALALNRSATMLATASEKGTVIRVFSVLDGKKLFEFRRGVKRYASIYSLSFSPSSTFLAASSNTETVHIFKVQETSDGPICPQPDGPLSWMEYLEHVGSNCINKVLSSSSDYLPTQVSDLLTMERAFAYVKLPFSDLKNICALTVIEQQLLLMVVSAEGILYVYKFDPVLGGECTLVYQRKVDEMNANCSQGPSHTRTTTYAQAARGGASLRAQFPEVHQHRPSSSGTSRSSTCDTTSLEQSLLAGQAFFTDLDAASIPQLDDTNEFPPMAMI